MDERLRKLLKAFDGSATESPQTESPKSLMKPMLTGLIASHLQKRWTEDEPGDKCFDHDESTMARLMAFIDSTATDPDRREVRTHLLQCPRCRYIYAKMRETVEESCKSNNQLLFEESQSSREKVPRLLRDNLRTSGPVVFPGNEVTEGTWEFGLLGS